VLDRKTLERIAEVFVGQKCNNCGSEARRLWRKQYYCPDCFPAAGTLQLRVHQVTDPGIARHR
jgi:hypothetical protein